MSWNTTTAANGSHVLKAVARDAVGNLGTSAAVTVTVSNETVVANGLVGAYSMDARSGSILTDSSPAMNNGTVSGTKWVSRGRFGSALSFDGVNALVTIPDAASLDLTTGMTLEAWVYPTGLSGSRTVILKEISGGLAYALYANDDAPQPATYAHITGQSLSTRSAGTTPIPLNTWTHLASTYDGTTLRLYVNGIEAGRVPVSGSMIQSPAPLRLGGNAVWGEYFAGRLDEVRLYNRALSATEIQADMATPIGTVKLKPPRNLRIVPQTRNTIVSCLASGESCRSPSG